MIFILRTFSVVTEMPWSLRMPESCKDIGLEALSANQHGSPGRALKEARVTKRRGSGLVSCLGKRQGLTPIALRTCGLAGVERVFRIVRGRPALGPAGPSQRGRRSQMAVGYRCRAPAGRGRERWRQSPCASVDWRYRSPRETRAGTRRGATTAASTRRLPRRAAAASARCARSVRRASPRIGGSGRARRCPG